MPRYFSGEPHAEKCFVILGGRRGSLYPKFSFGRRLVLLKSDSGVTGADCGGRIYHCSGM